MHSRELLPASGGFAAVQAKYRRRDDLPMRVRIRFNNYRQITTL